MKVTVNGINITEGNISTPRKGAWFGYFELETSNELSGKVTIVAGDLTMVGDVIPGHGGVSASIARYEAQGALAWEKEIKPRGYGSLAAIRLNTVLIDLSKDIGQNGKIVFPKDRDVGIQYVRRGAYGDTVTTARSMLKRLCPEWWTDTDNVVHCDPRDSGTVIGDYRVIRRNLTQGVRVVGTENPKAFTPGLKFEGEVISRVSIVVSGSGTLLYVWSER